MSLPSPSLTPTPGKLFVVYTVGDPYEADSPIAICTSMNKVRGLGLKKVWQHTKENHAYMPGTDPKHGFTDWDKSWQEYTNIMTGGTKRTGYDGLDRPSPYVEEVAPDVLLSKQDEEDESDD